VVARTLELGYLTDDEAATVAEVGYSPIAPLLWVMPLMETKLDNDVQLSKATDLVCIYYCSCVLFVRVRYTVFSLPPDFFRSC
jgi:hypothetical protein